MTTSNTTQLSNEHGTTLTFPETTENIAWQVTPNETRAKGYSSVIINLLLKDGNRYHFVDTATVNYPTNDTARLKESIYKAAKHLLSLKKNQPVTGTDSGHDIFGLYQ